MQMEKLIKAQKEEITSSSEKISVSEKSSQELPAFSEEQGSGSIRCCGWGELSRACKYENKNTKTKTCLSVTQ